MAAQPQRFIAVSQFESCNDDGLTVRPSEHITGGRIDEHYAVTSVRHDAVVVGRREDRVWTNSQSSTRQK